MFPKLLYCYYYYYIPLNAEYIKQLDAKSVST